MTSLTRLGADAAVQQQLLQRQQLGRVVQVRVQLRPRPIEVHARPSARSVAVAQRSGQGLCRRQAK